MTRLRPLIARARLHTLALGLAALGVQSAPAAPQAPKIQTSAPIKNLSLPTFTKEGFRYTLLRAGEAVLVSETQIDAKDLHLTLFTGEADARVDTVLISPLATAFTDTQQVSGPTTVRLVRDDLEVTGEQWSYLHRQKRVLIDNNARVVFRATLPALLK